MKKAKLIRNYSNEQTLGVLVCETFTCKTLELRWSNNESNKSCIPTGVYIVKYTRSNRLSKVHGKDFFTYEIQGVKDRAGIRIHSANYFFQLLGCIALGDELKDINLDSQLDVVHSGATIKKFEEFMNYEDFELTIV
jgi:hypothetical protein